MMYCTCMALWLFWVLNRNDTNFKLSIFDFFYDRNLKLLFENNFNSDLFSFYLSLSHLICPNKIEQEPFL
jgi:hypothetical protein